MKVVILCGGRGTRMEQETEFKPKPMIEIGGKPILWHIMKIYSYFGYNEFILCLGYKENIIKEYFLNYHTYQSDVTIDVKNGTLKYHKNHSEPWKVTMVDTGLTTLTGGRIKRIQPYVKNETFMLTYGDGVADINIEKILEYHKKHKKYATMTAVYPLGRFGALEIEQDGNIASFKEKPQKNSGWINGGFFVLEPNIFNYIEGDQTMWEREPLENLANDNKVAAYKNTGFWMCMDSPRDKDALEKLWASGKAPWKIWEEEDKSFVSRSCRSCTKK